MRPLLVTLALALALVAPAAAQDVAQALRDDPVYVDPSASDMLSASEADALRRRIEEAGVRLNVAILPERAGVPEQVAVPVA